MYNLDVVQIRLVKEAAWYSDTPINSGKDAVDFLARKFDDLDREIFCILNLTTEGKVINFNVVSIGTLNASLVSPREVFKSSILSNAASIIALHNHPSGSLKASKQDKLITQRLREAGELLDIQLLDHIIVGGKDGRFYSFHEDNLLNTDFRKQFIDERYNYR